MITSPSGKSYIGQCVLKLSDGTSWGTQKRFAKHCRPDSNCTSVRDAIIKYGSTNMVVEVLLRCDIDVLDYYEEKFIDTYETMSPNGYNLVKGGSANRSPSEETKAAISKSLKETFKNGFTDEHREKIRSARLGKERDKQPRKNGDNSLPKYIRYLKRGTREGYVVEYWPNRTTKTFTSNKLTLNEKLLLAEQHLESIR